MLEKLRLWYQAAKLSGSLQKETLTNPEAELYLRLEIISRGEVDPIEGEANKRRDLLEFEADSAWRDALQGGVGYQGPRGEPYDEVDHEYLSMNPESPPPPTEQEADPLDEDGMIGHGEP